MTANDPGYADVLFFHLDAAQTSRDFFGTRWPEARAVADPERTFYEAFSLRRGNMLELLGLRVVVRAVQALLKGNRMGRAQVDVFQMPGMFLVRGEQVLWEHSFGHAGDHPDLDELGEYFAEELLPRHESRPLGSLV